MGWATARMVRGSEMARAPRRRGAGAGVGMRVGAGAGSGSGCADFLRARVRRGRGDGEGSADWSLIEVQTLSISQPGGAEGRDGSRG